MLGYIVPLKAELKVRELEAYQAYYCGVCMSVKARYGNLPRLTLSYDSAFLAVMLSGISEKKEKIESKRCVANPFKKRNIVYDINAVDYAADVMLLLAYYKCADDYTDDKSFKALAGKVMLSRSLERLKYSIPEKCESVRSNIEALTKLEKQHCDAIDPAAEPFAKLMEDLFDWEVLSNNERVLLKKFGYHLGKWIFLIDAYDDIFEDAGRGSYNPLILQHKLKNAEETPAEFKERIKNRVEINLHLYLSEMSKAFEEINVVKNKGLIENIIYFGLHRKTDEVLGYIKDEEMKKEKEENAESI